MKYIKLVGDGKVKIDNITKEKLRKIMYLYKITKIIENNHDKWYK